jgi:hypothetical protein
MKTIASIVIILNTLYFFTSEITRMYHLIKYLSIVKKEYNLFAQTHPQTILISVNHFSEGLLIRNAVGFSPFK